MPRIYIFYHKTALRMFKWNTFFLHHSYKFTFMDTAEIKDFMILMIASSRPIQFSEMFTQVSLDLRILFSENSTRFYSIPLLTQLSAEYYELLLMTCIAKSNTPTFESVSSLHHSYCVRVGVTWMFDASIRTVNPFSVPTC